MGPSEDKTDAHDDTASADRRGAKLTEAQWREVFNLRCKSKRGLALTDSELDLIAAAQADDGARYVSMSPDVFDATVPSGSHARHSRNRGRKGRK